MHKTYYKNAEEVIEAFEKERNVEKGDFLQRFFKTAPGEYSHGDIFWGLTVPQTRKIAAGCSELTLSEVEKLVQSKVHEIRLCGLLVLVKRYKKNPAAAHKLYLKNISQVNNWDLVDLSAEHIVGAEFDRLKKNPLPFLSKLARSKELWERRIAILSTFHFIKKGDPNPTLEIATLLLNDTHDLIHKAVGWMLREVGKRCSHEAEVAFLNLHADTMPRTMLRYAIEQFSPKERAHFMNIKKVKN